MKHSYYTGIIALIILLFFIVSPCFAVPGEQFLVTEVNDGDTVTIKYRSIAGIPLKLERLRLIGIDAPELKQEPWGRRAKRHLKKIISKSEWVVNVEFDVEQRDQHGRLLGYLWTRKGQLVNEQMIEDGFAMLYSRTPNVKYAERLINAQKKAQLSRCGIWSENGLTKSPAEWRREHPRQQD